MSLRSLPFSERLFATCVLLALGAFLAGGLAFVAAQEGRTGSGAAPPARPRLTAVLEGVMAANTSPAEAAAFQAWMQAGATREAFPPVEAILANNCASCHGPGGQFPRLTTFEELRPLALEPAGGSLYAMLGARALHLALFPLVFLAAGVGYLRRTAWPGRRLLLGACAGALLFDAAQWWLRQGHAGGAWASRAALAALALAFLALAAVVLADLWRKPAA